MKRPLTFALAVALCALFTTFPYAANTAAPANKGVKTSVLVPQGMPVSVVNASVKTFDGRGLSRLETSITNSSGNSVDALRMVVFTFSPFGHLKGGEGWKEEVSLPSRDSKKFSFVVSRKVDFQDRAVFVLQSATGRAGTWGVTLDEVFAAARGGDNITLPPAQSAGATKGSKKFVKVSTAVQGTFCRDALANASNACKAGLDSFSCDEKNQSFNFSCKSPPQMLDQ